ncbi:MAG: CoA transferase [Pseudomonadales bacterium]|nr:CoA transferase [Pseudomonadales bacterium]
MKGILAGMRVVEASAFVAAPLGGMTLAQLGAEVIRIDNIGGGLDYRRWPVTEANQSLFWNGLNKAKKSITINFRDPKGSELAQQLITAPGKDSGFLLTNFPAKGWLDYNELKQHREDLIQLTIQGDRHGGSAVDYTVNPAIGLPFLTGPRDSTSPCNHVLPAWDLVTGQMAALGILAAERNRYRTGQGQHIKLALEDAALAAMGHLGFIAEAQLGTERERYGNDLFGAFGRDFTTADDVRVMVVGLTLKQWRALCRATETLAAMEELSTSLNIDLNLEGERFKARDHIAEIISQWISQHSITQLQTAFDREGVCWSRYRTIKDLVEQEESCSTHNPMFSQIEQPGIGRYLAAGAPWDFSGIERIPAIPAPRLGEHTDEILTNVLGFDSPTIGKLHDQDIIAGPEA